MIIGLLVFALLLSGSAILWNIIGFSNADNEDKGYYCFWIIAHSAIFALNTVNLINVVKDLS